MAAPEQRGGHRCSWLDFDVRVPRYYEEPSPRRPGLSRRRIYKAASRPDASGEDTVITSNEVPWRAYQEDVAAALEERGFKTEVDAPVKGVRGTHRIDVLATKVIAGLEVTWAAECKLKSRKVEQVHVLAFLRILGEIGASQGLFFAEAGCQSGAIAAADKTNVRLLTLEEFKAIEDPELIARRRRELSDELQVLADVFSIERIPKKAWYFGRPYEEDPGPFPVASPTHLMVAEALRIAGFVLAEPDPYERRHPLYNGPFPRDVNALRDGEFVVLRRWNDAELYIRTVFDAIWALYDEWRKPSEATWDNIVEPRLTPIRELPVSEMAAAGPSFFTGLWIDGRKRST